MKKTFIYMQIKRLQCALSRHSKRRELMEFESNILRGKGWEFSRREVRHEFLHWKYAPGTKQINKNNFIPKHIIIEPQDLKNKEKILKMCQKMKSKGKEIAIRWYQTCFQQQYMSEAKLLRDNTWQLKIP